MIVLFQRYANYQGLRPAHDFAADLAVMLSHAPRVLVFGDVPALRGAYGECVERVRLQSPMGAKRCLYSLHNNNKVGGRRKK